MAENEGEKAEPEKEPTDKKVRFHYVKSSAFRSIHADGVYGGVTPRYAIAASFYNERQPIPDQMVYVVKDDGTVGEEIRDERISRDGFVRELEATLILDVGLAKALVEWLNDKIALIEVKIKESEEQGKVDKQVVSEVPQ